MDLIPQLAREIPLIGGVAELAVEPINNNDLESCLPSPKGAKLPISLNFRVVQGNVKPALPPRLANGS